jgi:hypothetical protein
MHFKTKNGSLLNTERRYLIFKRTLHTYKCVRKNCFARERTKKATVITKKRNFHHTKRRTLAVQRWFYFFNIRTKKKVIQV